jgi:2-keto-4-pentenoate hydratase/2-oxohepta-3-ene-1,7-dioic acid hydratase in catechol pathway
VADPHNLRLTLMVNGGMRQDGSSADMIHRVPQIVAHISAIFTLEPGDVILTGTPAGVGQVVAGDVMEAEIEGVARLAIRVQ